MNDRVSPDRAVSSGPTRVLSIYALPDCPGWRQAETIAAAVREAGLPGVELRIIDLTRIDELPAAVIASPTWMLNGRRIALGNPDPDWLLALLGELPGGA